MAIPSSIAKPPTLFASGASSPDNDATENDFEKQRAERIQSNLRKIKVVALSRQNNSKFSVRIL